MFLKKPEYIFCALLVFLFACASNSRVEEQKEDSLGVITGKDSLETGITTESAVDSAFAGFYRTELPCRDCRVIQTLLLEPDGRFILEDSIKDSVPIIKEYKGNWAFANSTIILFENNAIIGKYDFVKNKIRTIERQGILLPDSVANNNMLSKQPSVLENSLWKNKKREGVSFYGIGTEPFWNISLIWDSVISYNEMDKAPLVFSFVSPLIQSDSLIFTPDKESNFSITLVHGICSDGMSDYFYDYKVIVKKDSIINTGCGFLLNKNPEFNIRY